MRPVLGMNCHNPDAEAHETAFGFHALSTWPNQVMSSGTPSSAKIFRASFMYWPERRKPFSIVERSRPW